MIHAIIVDDEERAITVLELMLKKYVKGVTVVAKSTDAVKGVELINTYRPDLVFLDINMPVLGGFDLLERLVFKNFHLIFCTAYAEYGLKALKSNASDYLLKPINLPELQSAVERVKAVRNQNQMNIEQISAMMKMVKKLPVKVVLPGKKEIQYVQSNEIVSIEADGHSSSVCLLDGKCVAVRTTLGEFELQLCTDESSFIRIHNSFIINVDFVTSYSKENGGFVKMKTSKQIPVSKHKKEAFLKKVNFG